MCPVPAAQRLAIAQVTPFAWEVTNEVNGYVARVSEELAGRGHRVLIIAPSQSADLVRETAYFERAPRVRRVRERRDPEHPARADRCVPRAGARRRHALKSPSRALW